MLRTGGTGQREGERRGRERVALLAAAWMVAGAGAGSTGCGRVGYDSLRSVTADGGLPVDTAVADVVTEADGPFVVADTGPPPPDREPSPVDAVADVPPVDGPDQRPMDAQAVMPASCTEPGGRIDPTSGRCYFVLATTAALWADARVGCEGQGAHLATLTSAAEHAFALSIRGPEELWIGLSQMGTGPWQWVTGEPVRFVAWAPLEPDEPADGRVRLAADGWHGTDPRRRYLALCERDP